jgi:hypothetical protein
LSEGDGEESRGVFKKASELLPLRGIRCLAAERGERGQEEGDK